MELDPEFAAAYAELQRAAVAPNQFQSSDVSPQEALRAQMRRAAVITQQALAKTLPPGA